MASNNQIQNKIKINKPICTSIPNPIEVYNEWINTESYNNHSIIVCKKCDIIWMLDTTKIYKPVKCCEDILYSNDNSTDIILLI